MKFGTVTEEQLLKIDFTLPPDHTITPSVLGGKKTEQTNVYVGSGNWGHASWNGKVYPLSTPAKKFREIYPNYFNTVELNATHYTIYKPEVLATWAASAIGKDFKFCPKFPQSISHFSSFTGVDGLTDAFLNSITAFGDNLGPAFLQISDQFSPLKWEPLYNYLSSLPRDFDVFLECRHPDWFKQSDFYFQQLSEKNIGLVITDTPGRRDCTHMCLTIPKLLLRFVCHKDHPTTFKRMEDWSLRISRWIENGLKEVYIFIHPGDETFVPDLVSAFIQSLNANAGLKLKLPFPRQTSLF